MSWTVEDISSLSIDGVTALELDQIRGALRVWHDRKPKNLTRSLYYDTEQAFKDLGLTLPPQLKKAKFYLGWGMQAVRKPAMRSQFDGLRLPGSEDPFEMGEILARNQFGLEFSQATISAYKHGVSFATVGKGDVGEAPAQILFHSAETAVGVWDARKRRMSLCLTISAMNKEGKPTEFVVYLPDSVLACAQTSDGWVAERLQNRTGRILAVPIRHDPQTMNPFGRSCLTNSSMALCDMAVRGFVRMEGNAEFYSTPQLALLGVDPEAFSGAIADSQKFKLAMDRFLALTKDQDGDKPDLKQLQQASMGPHSEMLRTVTMAFSGETNISPSSLGLVQDQPASAEAMRNAERELLINARYQNKFVLGPAIEEISTLAIMVRDNLTEAPKEAWKLSTRFVDPEHNTLSAQADAVQKLASSMDDLVKHPVLLGQLFDEDEVERIQADMRRGSVSDLVSGLTARVTAAQADPVVTEAAAERGAGA